MIFETKHLEVMAMAEPIGIKIERNSKGYNYEISIKSDTLDNTLALAFDAKSRLNLELHGEAKP